MVGVWTRDSGSSHCTPILNAGCTAFAPGPLPQSDLGPLGGRRGGWGGVIPGTVWRSILPLISPAGSHPSQIRGNPKSRLLVECGALLGAPSGVGNSHGHLILRVARGWFCRSRPAAWICAWLGGLPRPEPLIGNATKPTWCCRQRI